MSFGWQTESALLPSKAKPIAVDNKSMVSLKMLVAQHEQQRRVSSSSSSSSWHDHKEKRLRSILGKETHSKTQSLRPTKDVGEALGEDAGGSDHAAERTAQKALAAKAKLYEQIVNGETSGEGSLVDFASKQHHQCHNQEQQQQQRPAVGSGGDHLFPQQWAEQQPLQSQSFSPQHQSQSLPIELPYDGASHAAAAAVSHEYGPAQWQWGTTSRAAEAEALAWQQERQQERDYRQRMEQCVEQELDREGSGGMSRDARVKTQWEKTLQSSARDFLDQVHAETQRGREQTARDGRGAGDGKKSSRELRLELLKRKREERQPPDL
jgi:hypothetical protein